MLRQTSRSPSFGEVSASARGVPSRAKIPCRQSPRTSGYGWRNSRSRRRRPARFGASSRSSGRTRPGWSPPRADHRPIPGYERRLGNQCLDRVGQALATLDVARPFGQPRKQMPKPPGSAGTELLVRVHAQQLLGDGQRDDLSVGHHPPGVLSWLGQKIVGGAEHRNEQQVEVGVHRGPHRSSVRDSTADFDPAAYVTSRPTGPAPAVERLI